MLSKTGSISVAKDKEVVLEVKITSTPFRHQLGDTRGCSETCHHRIVDLLRGGLRSGNWGLLGKADSLVRPALDITELVPDTNLDSLEIGNKFQLDCAGKIQLRK